MFRFKDDFLINLSFMPIKEQLTYSKVIKEFIEVNGAQHYIKDHRWYGHSIKSDNEKKEYAKENNIPIYFIDARKSDIDYISQSIDKEIDYIKINKDNIVKILERRNISL